MAVDGLDTQKCGKREREEIMQTEFGALRNVKK
jgi:hypothetical protein